MTYSWERVHRPLHAPQDDSVANDTAISHFHDKLLHIREQLKTERGKQMAQKRHQFVSSLLSKLSRLFSMLMIALVRVDVLQMLDFLEQIKEEDGLPLH